MRVTPKMKIKEVLGINEHMLDAFMWLAPHFERLKYPELRKAMSERVNVKQAAGIAHIPLTEMLYVLNLAAGDDPDKLAGELRQFDKVDFEYPKTSSFSKPKEILKLLDTDKRVVFVDITGEADRHKDPLPKIERGLAKLKNSEDVLLVRHPFDPIPLRDLYARRGYASWAEERNRGDWYIYFYKPIDKADILVHLSQRHS